MTEWRPTERSRHGGVDRIPLPVPVGGLLLCGKHFVGPDVEGALEVSGATTVVCLTEAHELEDRYPAYVEWLRSGGRAVWHPIPDLHVSTGEEMRALVDELRDRILAGETLLVHCGAGIGRAGTVAAALLLAFGLDLEAAEATVAAHRPMAGPEAGPQHEFLRSMAGEASSDG